MALQLSITDQHGISVPQAYGVITDWNLQGAANIAVLTLAWYASPAAFAQGLPPFRLDPITLTLQEQQSGAGQLIQVLYGIVHARPDYSAATAVA